MRTLITENSLNSRRAIVQAAHRNLTAAIVVSPNGVHPRLLHFGPEGFVSAISAARDFPCILFAPAVEWF
jgi:hypothetical protein